MVDYCSPFTKTVQGLAVKEVVEAGWVTRGASPLKHLQRCTRFVCLLAGEIAFFFFVFFCFVFLEAEHAANRSILVLFYFLC